MKITIQQEDVTSYIEFGDFDIHEFANHLRNLLYSVWYPEQVNEIMPTEESLSDEFEQAHKEAYDEGYEEGEAANAKSAEVIYEAGRQEGFEAGKEEALRQAGAYYAQPNIMSKTEDEDIKAPQQVGYQVGRNGAVSKENLEYYQNGYDHGYKLGVAFANKGKQRDEEATCKELLQVRTDGHQEGFSAQDGYTKGHNEGYTKGRADGIRLGRIQGSKQGYEEGVAAMRETYEPMLEATAKDSERLDWILNNYTLSCGITREEVDEKMAE